MMERISETLKCSFCGETFEIERSPYSGRAKLISGDFATHEAKYWGIPSDNPHGSYSFTVVKSIWECDD